MSLKPVVVIASVNGGARQSHGDTFVPTSPAEIAEEAALCERAGASALHFHGRDEVGKNTGDPEVYAEILRRVREKTTLVLQSTNGIGHRIDPDTGRHVFPGDDERLALMRLDPGPDFFGAATASIDFYNPAGGYPEEASFQNSHHFLRETIRIIYARGSTIEFEVPHVTALHRLHRILSEEGVDPLASHIMLVMPVFPAFAPNHRSFMFLQDEAHRLFPNAIRSHAGVGKEAFESVTLGLALGFECVRVGFEDTLYLPDGTTAKRNHELIEKVVEIAKIFGRRPATPEETRKILQLDRSS